MHLILRICIFVTMRAITLDTNKQILIQSDGTQWFVYGINMQTNEIIPADQELTVEHDDEHGRCLVAYRAV